MMSNRVFTGSFAALEDRLVAEIQQVQGGNPLVPVAVLVGSNLVSSYLRTRLADCLGTSANVRLMTFAELVRRLRVFDAADDRPSLPEAALPVLVETVLLERSPAVFRKVEKFPGFRDALVDTFRDLRDAGVAPQALDEAIPGLSAREPDRRAHLAGLAELYRRFRQYTSRFRGVDDEYRAAARNCGRAGGILGSPRLFVYGFYDVTGLQADLLDGLAASLQLTHFIPYVDESVSAFAGRYVEARGGPAGRVEALPDGPVRTDLDRLCAARAGFGPVDSGRSAAGGEPDGTVAFVSAPGDSRLALEAVREVVRAASEGVIRDFSEAAVLVRQPASLVPVLEEAFRLRDIPCVAHGGRPFADSPLAGAVLSAVRLYSNSFARDEVLKAFELTAAAHDTGFAAWNTAEWRLLTNDARFLSGFAEWQEATLALVNETQSRARRARLEAGVEDPDRHRLTAAVADARAEAALQLREAWIRLAQAASAWPVAESWSGWASLLLQRFLPLLGRSRDWPSFVHVLDGLSQLDAVTRTAGMDPRVPFGRMTSALEESIRRLSVPVGRLGRSGVNIVGISAARGLRFPLVIVAGLEEGRFPARLRQDPLLLDGERASVGEPARLPLKSMRGDEEKLLFDMAVRSAGRRLVLATSRLDEETDREILPSEFFLRAVSAAAGRMLAARDVTEITVPAFRSVSLENPAPRPGLPALDDSEILLRLITAAPAERRTAVAALSRSLPELLAGPLEHLESRWIARLTAHDGRIFDPHLIERVARDFGPAAGPVSASRIEEYAACPYRFFLKRVMGLERWEEAEAADALDPLERGTVVHAILERFMRGYGGGRFARAGAEDLKRTLLAEARLLLEEARPAGIPALLWEIERERLEALLAAWLDLEVARREDGLLPDLFELSFGTFDAPGAAPSLTVRGGSHSFEFRGRIDRVDRSPDGREARVIDYKTGRFPATLKKLSENPLMGGERVQIAIYREALRLMDESGGPERATGEYLHLDPLQRKAVRGPYSDEMLCEAANQLPALLGVVGDGITGGIFFRRTHGTVWGDNNCNHCDFPSVCGRDRQARTEHKSADPEVARLTSPGVDPGDEEEQ